MNINIVIEGAKLAPTQTFDNIMEGKEKADTSRTLRNF